MSGTVERKKKRDKLLGRLPFRSSPTSQPASSQPSASQLPVAPPSTTAVNVPAQPSANTTSPTGQAVGGASSASDVAFLGKVLGRLTEEQQSTLNSSYAQSANDIGSTLTAALQAAESKKQLCISKQWTLKIGSRTISTREKAEKVVELLEKFKRVGDIVAGADPIHAGLPWAGVSLILQVAASEKQQMDAMLSGIATALSMQRTLDIYLAFFHTLAHSDPATALGTALVETYATVLGFIATSIGLLTKGSASRFWAALLGGGELQQFGSTCLAAGHQVDVAASNCDRSLDARGKAITQECKGILDLLLGDITAIKHQTARIELSISLAKLPRASTAAFDSTDEERMPRCLKSTRIELLSDIQKWVQDPASAQFFWLQGVAGTGKSTVARTIANIFHDHQILGASFFFKRGHAERGSADLFFATIAIQLAQRIPGVDGAIAQLLSDEVGVYTKGIHTQFRDLILSPLQATSQSRQAAQLELVILIDALDECDNEGDRKDDTKGILECLAQLKGVHGLRLRLIVTSRLEFPVEVGFAALGSDVHDDILLHELPRNEIERDIRIFIETEFEELRHTLFQRRRREILHDGWPGDDIVQDLTKRSVPLFIFASTVCSFVADGRFTPQAQLKKILDDRNQVQLSSTYLLVLQAMTPESENGTNEDWDAEFMDNFRKIVGLIIFSTEAPSMTTIAVLLDLMTGQVEATLDNLHSVLDVTGDLDRPVRPFHLSFIEFLARPNKSAHKFQIDERATHKFIADRCLATMMQPGRLHQDICRMRKPGSKRREIESRVIETSISPALSYACRYWVHHLEASNAVLDDRHATLKFFSGCFLYWFEAMSWLGKASEVPRTLRKLQALTKMDGASSTVEVLLDAYQFARHNQFIVDLAPLQLYASALVFAPDSSTIKTLFKPHMPSWLLTPPKIEGTWRSDVLKFEGHTLAIRAVAFSPDDKLLGTCSRDGTTRIWDTIDASCSLMVSYDEHKHFPGAIAFSSDSSKFAVAYSEANLPVNLAVIIHSARTGTSLRTMQCPGLWSSVLRPAIAFEDDEIVLVAADEDRVQILRSVNDSNNFIRHWTPHFPNHDILYGAHVCISQNASLIYYSAFLGYKSVSISVLDPKTRVVLSRRDLEEDICHISGMANDCGAAAPVYKVSDFETQSSNVWSLDVEHQDKSTHLFDCASSIWDGFSLANARDKVAYIMRGDFTVHVEAIPKRKMVGERRDASLGRKVAVAPRGNLVADWDDGSLTVINTKGLVVTRTVGPDFDFDDTIYEPKSLMISPDCQYIALGQDEGTTVWNIEIGKSSEYNMIKRARVLAFSDDNQLMATHQWEFDSLRVWDLDSRQQLMLETDQTNLPDFRRLKFSADGKDLITEHGRLHIATATWTMSESTDPSSFGKDVGLSSMPGIRRSDWVQFDDEDLLWIPDVYRAVLDSYDARGGTVALGQEDGSLLIMKISDPW